MATSRSTSRYPSRSISRPTPASTSKYSTFPLPELLTRWEHGELTAEQMVGHLLQHVTEVDKRVRQLEHPPTTEPTQPALGASRS